MNAEPIEVQVSSFRSIVNNHKSKLEGSKSPEDIQRMANHFIDKLNIWMEDGEDSPAIIKMLGTLISALKKDPALGIALMEALEDQYLDDSAVKQ